MKNTNYQNKSKFLKFVQRVFLVWIICLIILAIFAQRNVAFYDLIEGKNVSSKYDSRIPLLRYFLEPIIGIAFVFSVDFNWISGFIISYIIIQVIYRFYIKKKRGFEPSEKVQLLSYPLRDFLRFTGILIGGGVACCMLFLLFAYIFIGFYFVNLYFMFLVQIFVPIGLTLVALKGGYILAKYRNPKYKFNYSEKFKKKEKKNHNVNEFKKHSAYCAGFIFLMLGLSVLLVSFKWPTQKIEVDLDHDEFLFDFHVHTTYSDGYLTPEERVMWYIEQGISGAAFSDHDNQRGAKEARKFVKEHDLDFTVIIAEEWTDHDNDIHMNIFGLEHTVVPRESDAPTCPFKSMNAEDTIKHVKREGGYIFVNHYNAEKNEKENGRGVPYTLEQLMDWGVDGFEIVNGGNPQDKKIRKFCLDNNLTCIAGTDEHRNNELDTFIKLRLKNPKDKSVDNIFKNLRRNDHEVVAINDKPRRIEVLYPFNDVLDFFGLGKADNFINYLLNLDRGQVVSWIIWSCGVYLIFILFYKKLKNIDVKTLREKIL